MDTLEELRGVRLRPRPLHSERAGVRPVVVFVVVVALLWLFSLSVHVFAYVHRSLSHLE